MKIVKLLVFLSSLALLTVYSGGTAKANGTITAVFEAPDGTSMTYTYLYLRDASKPTPMERYFSPADQIYGPFNPTAYSNGAALVNYSVPAGSYKVRITRRGSGTSYPYGPPAANDYTWSPHTTITVTDNQTTNLGTVTSGSIGASAIVISGVAKDWNTGNPLGGKYVRAQPIQCVEGYVDQNYVWHDPNNCGYPNIYMAQAKTDSQGRYTILLRDPGSYYVVVSRDLYGHDKWQEYSGNRRVTGWEVGPVPVAAGDQVTMPDMMIPLAYQ